MLWLPTPHWYRLGEAGDGQAQGLRREGWGTQQTRTMGACCSVTDPRIMEDSRARGDLAPWPSRHREGP